MHARAGWPVSWWWASPTLRWCALALLLAFYAVLSLEPFDWRIPPRLSNGALPLADGANGALVEGQQVEGQQVEGWRFPTPGIVVSRAPHDWLGAATAAETLTVSLEVRPYLTDQPGPARILTISPDVYFRNLTLAQEDADLVVRLRTAETTANALRDRRPIARVADVFQAGRWVAIDLRIQPGRLSIDVAGEPALQAPLPPAVLGTWEPAFDLALGNELTCNRPWLGEIREAVVMSPDGAANYASTRLVEVPDTCLVTRHPPMLVPFERFLPDDMLRNTLMYMPLGCLLGLMARVRNRRRFGALVAAIAGISLAFESAQLFLDSRFPSADDLIFNTLGGIFGLALVFWVAGRMPGTRQARL